MLTVSDTSPISNLAIIGQLNLLHEQFGDVLIPEAVYDEFSRMASLPARRLIVQAVESAWLSVHKVNSGTHLDWLLWDLDRGEAEAIALAVELKADILLIDELEGRRMARESGLTVRGVLGVLMRAKKTGSLAAIKPSIEMLKSQARFFVAAELEQRVLNEVGE